MTNPANIKLAACAKVNLALSVGPPTPPKGYHPIASWFAAIELCDGLTISRLDANAPSRYELRWAADAPRPTPIDWPIEKDLAVRAHRLLEERAGRTLPISLVLEKRIPVGGGLGGGSSDAAAMLIAINRLFALDLGAGELRSLSTRLGSDIAFFLDELCVEARSAVPRAALVTGFGERIERVAAPKGELLLFFPPFGCPTGPVYQALDRDPPKGLREERIRSIIESSNSGSAIDHYMLFNDLAHPACIVEPRLAEVWPALARACGDETTVLLSGSGSTLFVMIQPEQAWKMRERCRKAAPDVLVLPSRFAVPESVQAP